MVEGCCPNLDEHLAFLQRRDRSVFKSGVVVSRLAVLGGLAYSDHFGGGGELRHDVADGGVEARDRGELARVGAEHTLWDQSESVVAEAITSLVSTLALTGNYVAYSG